MLDYLAKSFLIFSNGLVVIPLMIVGLLWLDRLRFYHAVCLVLLSILVNVALKISFQVPLSPSLGKAGYAFPSGHMQLATVLYSWFALQSKNNGLRGLIVILLLGIALSLMHFDYHDFYDVLAGVFFALLLLSLYYLADLKWPKKLPWLVLFVATVLLIYIQMLSPFATTHVWIAYYLLSGFIVAKQIIKS